MDIKTDVGIGKWTYRQMWVQANGHTDRCRYRQMDIQTDVQMDIQTDVGIGKWTYRQM
jgi:hypothetical protein